MSTSHQKLLLFEQQAKLIPINFLAFPLRRYTTGIAYFQNLQTFTIEQNLKTSKISSKN